MLQSSANVNIKMTKKWKIKMYIFQGLLLSLWFYKGTFFFQTIWRTFDRNDLRVMQQSIQHCICQCRRTKYFPHLENGIFVVIIVQCFSYRLSINWKNRLAESASIGIYPISSMISTLYFAKNFILASKRFSRSAFFNCVISDSKEIKYVE